MTDDDNPIERPALVAGACAIGWIFAFVDLSLFTIYPEAVNYTIAHHHHHFHWLIITANIILILAYWGVWRLKLWGVALFIFTTMYFFFIARHLSLTDISITDFIINIIVFLMILPHLNNFG